MKDTWNENDPVGVKRQRLVKWLMGEKKVPLERAKLIAARKYPAGGVKESRERACGWGCEACCTGDPCDGPPHCKQDECSACARLKTGHASGAAMMLAAILAEGGVPVEVRPRPFLPPRRRPT